jgi:uncharacterized protein DUF1116
MSIQSANQAVLDRLIEGQPLLVDCRPASQALGLTEQTILHAGPPLCWEEACATLQAAILCAIRYEGWAPDEDRAREQVVSGRVRLEPCHHRGAVGPMTGLITPSMPVFIVENRTQGNRAFATIKEGLGKVLRFGAYDESAIERLRWLAREAGPPLGAAIRAAGGIDLRAIMAQALRMGDEMHQQNLAASSLLARKLMGRWPTLGRRRTRSPAWPTSWPLMISSS